MEVWRTIYKITEKLTMFRKKSSNNKLFSVIFLLFLIGILLYLTFKLEDKNILIIRKIEIKGADHLSKEDYFTFAKFDKYEDYKYLSLPIIKDRIIKHPYIADADVEFEGTDKVIVNLNEKVFEAQYIAGNNKNYLVTNNFELVPVLLNTKNLDMPIISHSATEKKYKALNKINKSDDLFTGLKIITTQKYLNEELFANLNEIDLNNGKTIMVDFDNLAYPIHLNREDIIKKMVSFNELYSTMKGSISGSNIDYIDMRFSNRIYLKLAVASNNSNGDNNE